MFAIQILMVLASMGSYYLNRVVAKVRYGGKRISNCESPLTDSGVINSIVSMVVCFAASKLLPGDFTVPQMVNGVLTDVPLRSLWWVLSAN